VVFDDLVALNHIIPHSIQLIYSHQAAAGAGIKTAQLETLFDLVNVTEAANDGIIIRDFFDLFFGEVFCLTTDICYVSSERLEKFRKQSVLCLNQVNQLYFRKGAWDAFIIVLIQVAKNNFICDVSLIGFLKVIYCFAYRFKDSRQLAVEVEYGILIGFPENI
jgi:hypothetical protein